MFIGNIGMGHLAERVDAGVGAAGAVHVDFLAPGQTGQGFLQNVLHGASAGLALPTAEGGAIIGQR
jgi:hypothetical protein